MSADHVTCDAVSLVCVPLPKDWGGQACSVQGGCDIGEFCDNGTCAAQRDTGPCTPNISFSLDASACKDSSYCDLNTSNCIPTKAEGAACAADGECTRGSCAGGVCGPRIPVDADICAGSLE